MATETKGKPVLILEDQAGLKMYMTRDDSAGHMSDTGRRANRHEIAELSPDIPKAPDEVWLEKGKKSGHGTLQHMRFHKGERFAAVSVRAGNDGLNIATWE